MTLTTTEFLAAENSAGWLAYAHEIAEDSPFGSIDYKTEYHKLPRRFQNVDYFLRVKRNPAGATDARPALVPGNHVWSFLDAGAVHVWNGANEDSVIVMAADPRGVTWY